MVTILAALFGGYLGGLTYAWLVWNWLSWTH